MQPLFGDEPTFSPKDGWTREVELCSDRPIRNPPAQIEQAK